MNESLLSLALVLVFLGVLSSTGFGQADPELGTWTLNREKSTYHPGPPLKSQIRTIEAAGDGQRLRNETVTGDGTHAVVGYFAKFDGKDYPVTGSPYGDAVTLERLDSHTVEARVKKAGKVVLTDTRVVSKNGQVLTINQIGLSPNGESIHNVLVYDKSR